MGIGPDVYGGPSSLSSPGRGEPLYQRLPAFKPPDGQDGPGGGRAGIIRAQDVFIEDLTGVMDYEAVENGGKTAVVLGQKLEEGTYRTIKERGLGGTGEEGTVMSYQMPVRTTPLAYVPQPWALPWQGCWDWAVWVCYFWDACSTLCFYCHGMSHYTKDALWQGGGSRSSPASHDPPSGGLLFL